MKNPMLLAAIGMAVFVPPFAMFVMEKNEARKELMAILPADLPGQTVMYTSPR